MILLENWSEINTYIKITDEAYAIMNDDSQNQQVNGIGGFSESGDLVGIYVSGDKLYFQYNSTSYETTPKDLVCSCESIGNGKHRFVVEINGRGVCDIIYEPYVSPFMLTFGDDDDEFDFLLQFSRLLRNEDSIERLWMYNRRGWIGGKNAGT